MIWEKKKKILQSQNGQSEVWLSGNIQYKISVESFEQVVQKYQYIFKTELRLAKE